MNDARFVYGKQGSELKKLDWALSIMGYSSRADWYRERKGKLSRKQRKKEVKTMLRVA